MYNPDLLQGMPAAAARFADAIITGECCGLVGGFECDGICSSAVIMHFGRWLTAASTPTSSTESQKEYGLNEAGLRAIKDVASTLVITVDLGVTAIKEAKPCSELGMDLIVNDHHALNADGILPEAIAVVNPHIPSPYPFANLCGAGVAFALLVTTRRVLRERGFFKRRP